MKHFLIMVLGFIMLTACGTYKPLYHANIVGDADGQVEVTFQDGRLAMDGTAGIDFYYGNDSTLVTLTRANVAAVTLEEAFNHTDKKVREAAKAAQDMTNTFQVNVLETKAMNDTTKAGGTYYFTFDALFIEPVTGTQIHTHKVLTNRQ